MLSSLTAHNSPSPLLSSLTPSPSLSLSLRVCLSLLSCSFLCVRQLNGELVLWVRSLCARVWRLRAHWSVVLRRALCLSASVVLWFTCVSLTRSHTFMRSLHFQQAPAERGRNMHSWASAANNNAAADTKFQTLSHVVSPAELTLTSYGHICGSDGQGNGTLYRSFSTPSVTHLSSQKNVIIVRLQ